MAHFLKMLWHVDVQETYVGLDQFRKIDVWLVDNDIIHEFLWIICLCVTCLLQISTKNGFSFYFDHRANPFWIARSDDILFVVQTTEHSHFRISAATSRHIQLYSVKREDSCTSKRPMTYRSTADEIDHMLKIRLMNQMMDSICSVILSFDNNHQKLQLCCLDNC